MALDDGTLRLTVSADVSPIIGSMNQAAAVVSSSADKMAASFQAAAVSSTEAAAQIGGLDRAMSMATGRIAGMEAGAGMLGGALGRVGAASAAIAPILAEAFPVFAAIAAVQIIVDLSDKLAVLREEATATVTKWDDFSASVTKQADSLQVENLKLGDTIAKLEGHPEPNQLAIGLLEAKIKSDDLVTSLENANAKAQDLLEKGGVSFWSEMLTGAQGTGDFSAAIKEPIAEYELAFAKLRIANQTGNAEDIAAARRNAEEKRALIVSVADQQLQATQAEMKADLERARAAGGFAGPDAIAAIPATYTPLLAMIEQVKASYQEMGTISRRSEVNTSLEKHLVTAQRATEQEKLLSEEYKKSWEVLEREEKAIHKLSMADAQRLDQQLNALDAESVAVAKFGAADYVAGAKEDLQTFEAFARGQIANVEGTIAAAEAKASARGRGISGAQFLSEPQKQAAEKNVLAEQYASENAAIQPLIASLQAEQVEVQQGALNYDDKVAAVQRLQGRIDIFTNRLAALKAKMDDMGQDNWAVELGNKVHKGFQQMDATVNRSLDSWVTGHKTFAQAVYGIWSGLAQDATMQMVKMTEKWVEQLLIQKLVHLTTVTAQTAATATGQTAQTAATTQGVLARTVLEEVHTAKVIALKLGEVMVHTGAEAEKAVVTIASVATRMGAEMAAHFETMKKYAAEAAAATYSAISQIPVVGPFLAPPAATAAYAAVLMFEKGGINPIDQMAYLHEEEMVLPKHISTFIQERAAAPAPAPSPQQQPAFAGAGAGGGDNHFHISALDSRSFEDALRRNPAQLMKMARGLVRDGWRPR